jgi:hypothetical protein
MPRLENLLQHALGPTVVLPELLAQAPWAWISRRLSSAGPNHWHAFLLLMNWHARPSACHRPASHALPLLQHLVTFFKAYTGRLNGTAKHLVEKWDAGERYPAAAADDAQAHSIVKASRSCWGPWVQPGRQHLALICLSCWPAWT